jgi:hypothetical protein
MIAFFKLGGLNWAARLLQTGRGSYSNDRCVQEFSGYKAGQIVPVL